MTDEELKRLQMLRHELGSTSMRSALDTALRAEIIATDSNIKDITRKTAQRISDTWFDYAYLLEKEHESYY